MSKTSRLNKEKAQKAKPASGEAKSTDGSRKNTGAPSARRGEGAQGTPDKKGDRQG